MAKEKTIKGVTKLKRFEVLNLNEVLSSNKISKLSKESAFALLDMKIELNKHVNEINEAQRLAANQLRPADLKEGEKNEILEKEWNDKFRDFAEKHLNEEIDVKLQKISKEQVLEFVKENDLSLDKINILQLIVE